MRSLPRSTGCAITFPSSPQRSATRGYMGAQAIPTRWHVTVRLLVFERSGFLRVDLQLAIALTGTSLDTCCLPLSTLGEQTLRHISTTITIGHTILPKSSRLPVTQLWS